MFRNQLLLTLQSRKVVKRFVDNEASESDRYVYHFSLIKNVLTCNFRNGDNTEEETEEEEQPRGRQRR
jgi:hypothetical protein